MQLQRNTVSPGKYIRDEPSVECHNLEIPCSVTPSLPFSNNLHCSIMINEEGLDFILPAAMPSISAQNLNKTVSTLLYTGSFVDTVLSIKRNEIKI